MYNFIEIFREQNINVKYTYLNRENKIYNLRVRGGI